MNSYFRLLCVCVCVCVWLCVINISSHYVSGLLSACSFVFVFRHALHFISFVYSCCLPSYHEPVHPFLLLNSFLLSSPLSLPHFRTHRFPPNVYRCHPCLHLNLSSFKCPTSFNFCPLNAFTFRVEAGPVVVISEIPWLTRWLLIKPEYHYHLHHTSYADWVEFSLSSSHH